MASLLFSPPAQTSPSQAVQISRGAPSVLNRRSLISSVLPFTFLQGAESAETWATYERVFLACLRTRDDESARRCLEKLTQRFGESNERIMGLKGMYEEAVARDDAALQKILRGYEKTVAQEPTNIPIAKRRIALLRSLSRPDDAIAALVQLLDNSPTDAEAWSELSDLYLQQGLYAQAIFSLEEVLLITPNAWNVHARMGEVLYMAATTKESGNPHSSIKMLVDSMRSYCRSIELCDDYLRAYYGLKLVTDRLVQVEARTLEKASDSVEVAAPSYEDVKRLNESVTSKLTDIVRRSSDGKNDQDPDQDPEIVAARELLGRDGSSS